MLVGTSMDIRVHGRMALDQSSQSIKIWITGLAISSSESMKEHFGLYILTCSKGVH
jgi:hypothetical protein